MKVYLDTDEWYPVFTLEEATTSSVPDEVEVGDEFFERYKKAMKEFEDVQNILGDLPSKWKARY